MRRLGRVVLCAAVAVGVTAATNRVASVTAEVRDGERVAAYRPTSTTQSIAPTATTVAPAPTTTTTIAPPTTTTVAPAPATTVAPPPPAPAPAAAPPAAATTPEEKGARALELIDYPWQRLGYSVTYAGPRAGLLGKANCETHQITVFVRPSQTVRQVAFVTAFELGHAVDCGTMDSQRRTEWAAIRGFPAGWTWFPSCMCTEDRFGSGDISMVFASWLVPNGGYGWRSQLAPPPGATITQLLPYLRPPSVG